VYREEGIKEGKAEGIKEGIKEGEARRSLEMARKMLRRGYGLEEASEITALPIETLKRELGAEI
ncbi:MAG: hypothetical protein LBD92_05455, partial [Oscillospiraceae bacterium]|jgi:predicted transposase YdaD|nr:hypothetical protein [Oscillospiraceae bacterium]